MTVSCAFCNGTGVQPHSLKMVCLACHGKGKVEFEHAAIACPVCKGNGRASSLSLLSCIQCRGVGMIEEEKVYERKEHEKKRKLDIIKNIFRKIGERLFGTGKWIWNIIKGTFGRITKWIKNRLVKEILWFKTVIYKFKKQLMNGITRAIK